jgi:hypothetical protein
VTHYRGDAFRIVRSATRGSGSADRRLVFVLECYLDDSGSSDLPVATLSGFAAPLSVWDDVEPKLNAILIRHGVPILHAKEFHDTVTPFNGWKRVRKRSFADELFSVSKGRLFALSFTLTRNDFLQVQKNHGNRMSPVGGCFAVLMMQVVLDPVWRDEIKQDGVAFLVESGKYNGELANYFEMMTKDSAVGGSLRAISFIPKGACRAIQIADFFAFHARRVARNHARFGGKLSLPPCPYIDTIRRHCRMWHQVSFKPPAMSGKKNYDFKNEEEFRAYVESVKKGGPI